MTRVRARKWRRRWVRTGAVAVALVTSHLTISSSPTVDAAPGPLADLAVELETVATITPGAAFDYGLTVSNSGPQDARDVVITGMLPAGVSFRSSSIPPASVGDTVRFALPVLEPNTSIDIVISVRAGPDVRGSLQSRAEVRSDVARDPDRRDNRDRATVRVVEGLVLGPRSLPPARVGEHYEVELTVVNGTPPYECRLVAGQLPPGLNLDGCATLLGRPTEPGRFDFEVEARDSSGAIGVRGYAVRVIAPRPPTLSLRPVDTVLPDGFVDEEFRVVFEASGGRSPLLLVGTNPPPGTSFGSLAGNRLELRGVPSQAGTFAASVTVIDSATPSASIVRTYTVVIRERLTITPDSLPLVQVGEPFAAAFDVVNGVPPTTFTSSDPLPPGLALRGTVLSGFPTQVGAFPFTIHAVDAAGNRGARDFVLTVLPAGLLIVTDELPDAVVGADYVAQVDAIGGVEPYVWRVHGELPDGVVFGDNGTFTGRPTGPGISDLVVTVSDQAGSETSKPLRLRVLPAPPP